MDIGEILADLGVRLRSHSCGTYHSVCPQCSHLRKKKTIPCLTVTIETDIILYKCHHCGWEGGRREGNVHTAYRTPTKQERKEYAKKKWHEGYRNRW